MGCVVTEIRAQWSQTCPICELDWQPGEWIATHYPTLRTGGHMKSEWAHRECARLSHKRQYGDPT